jgi:crossover junction endodeoxyribonuclease RuvC
LNYVGLDPSTKTGLVVLNEAGEVLHRKEYHLVNGIKSTDAEVLAYATAIIDLIPFGSLVSIEGFSFGSKGKGVSTQYAVGFALRYQLLQAGIKYFEATPSQVKKFATGKGNTTKDNMTIPILRMWNFEHPSDNVRDAFVLAQIAKVKEPHDFSTQQLTKYQTEVIEAINNPPDKKKKAK